MLLPAKRPPPAQGRKYFPRRGKKNRHLPAAALPEQFFPCFSPQREVLCFGEIWFRIFFYFIFFRAMLGVRDQDFGARGCSSDCSLLLPSWERFGRESDPDFRYLSKIFTEILLAIGGGRRHSGRPAPGGCASPGLRWGTSPEEAGTARGGFSSAVGKGEKRPGKVEAASAQPPVCLGSPAQPQSASWCTARPLSRSHCLLSVTLRVYWDRLGKYPNNEAASTSPKSPSGGCRSALFRY